MEDSPDLTTADIMVDTPDRSRLASSGDAISPTDMQSPFHYFVDHVPSSHIEVQISPVKRRWKYKTFDARVKQVLKEIESSFSLSYRVEMQDGTQTIVSSNSILPTSFGLTSLLSECAAGRVGHCTSVHNPDWCTFTIPLHYLISSSSIHCWAHEASGILPLQLLSDVYAT